MGQAASMGRRSRFGSWCGVLGWLALGVGVAACGNGLGEGADEQGGQPDAPDTGEVIGKSTSALTNSDPTLDQRYLAGMGYLDGTTCDIWPRDLDFSTPDDGMGVIANVLSRYSISSSVIKLKTMTDRLRDLKVRKATVIGSKNELVVTVGKLTTNQSVLVVIDESTRKGFFLDNEWLCTEELQRINPTLCEEKTVKVGSINYSVLGRTTPLSVAWSPLVGSDGLPFSPPKTAVLVAPQIRFTPTSNPELAASAYVIAIGQRVYGGGAYVAGEDLSQRTDNVKFTVVPSIPSLAVQPDDTEWRRAVREPRGPGFVAIIGDEVGGISELKGAAPAAVEQLIIANIYPEDRHYDAVTKTMYVRPKAYFNPTLSECVPTRVPGTLGTINCVYDVTVSANPRIRLPGGSGASFLLAGKTAKTTTLFADEATALTAQYALKDLRAMMAEVMRPVLDQPNTVYLLNVVQGSKVINTIDGKSWTDSYDYRVSSQTDTQNGLAASIDSAFPATSNLFGALARADAATDTAVRQVSMGGQLFSRGAFADVLFGRSELESLRSGEVSPSWSDTWRLMTDYNLGSIRLPGYDPAVDYGIDPARRRRAEQMAAYVQIAPTLPNKSNVLGLPYGQTASGWFGLPSEGVPSIYAAEKRWSQIGSLVSQFQDAADKSDELTSAAQRDALLKLIQALNTALKRDITNTTNAASTVAAAARANAATQQVSLDEFQKGSDKLFKLSSDLQLKMNDIWNCPADFTADQCVAAAKAKMSSLESACNPSGGLDWMKPFVSLAANYIPALAVVNGTLKTFTGKDLVDSMSTLIQDPGQANGMITNAVDHFVSTQSYLKTFADLDKYVQVGANYSKAMHKIIDEAPRTCKASGQPQTNMDNFRTQIVLVDSLMQNYAVQLSLVHAMISGELGHIGYLGTEGTAYEEQAANQNKNLADLDAATQPLISKLTAMTDFKYSGAAVELRSFMTNACRTTMRASRAAQADLHMISQALQTSTGSTDTKPYLVVPANANWHWEIGSSTGLSRTDKTFGFAMSLWDRSSFDTRFTPDGSGLTTPYIHQAGTRFAQLMNGEVCSDSAPKPATRYVVRKVFTGPALNTLVSTGKLDFNVTLDDIVNSAKDGSNATKGVIAQNLSTGDYTLKLESGFVINAGYSVCNGATGTECTTRVASGSLGAVAGGALNSLFVANRGTGFSPIAMGSSCPSGSQQFDSTATLLLGTATKSVSSCVKSVLTPRAWSPATYWDFAAAPDSQVLNNNGSSCTVDAQVLAAQPLQGLPILGTWALTTTKVNATALTASMAPAPISDVALPAPAKATGVEVLFIVGAEPVNLGSAGGYALKP